MTARNDVEWLKSQGARGKNASELWTSFLTDKGYTGSLTDMKREYEKHIGGKNVDVNLTSEKWVVHGNWFIKDNKIIANDKGSARIQGLKLGSNLIYKISFDLEGSFKDGGFLIVKLGHSASRAINNLGKNKFKVISSGGEQLVFSLHDKGSFKGEISNINITGDI